MSYGRSYRKSWGNIEPRDQENFERALQTLMKQMEQKGDTYRYPLLTLLSVAVRAGMNAKEQGLTSGHAMDVLEGLIAKAEG